MPFPWSRRAGVALAVALGVGLRLWSALAHDTLKDGYHTWWIAAKLAATGSYVDPFAQQVGARWLPGYHFSAAGVLLLAGPHALLALRLVNVAFAAFAIALVARLAERLRPGAGVPAALLYALAPWEAITAARAMPESAAWLLALLASNALLAPPDERARWPWLGGAALALACLFRYEAWVLAALFLARAAWLARTPARRAHGVASALLPALVMLAWAFASSARSGAFFAGEVLAQGRAEAAFHEAVGAYPAAPLVRVWRYSAFAFAGLVVALALALVAAARRPARFPVLVVGTFLAAVAVFVGSSSSDGSPRYFGIATPFAAALAGEGLVELRERLRPRLRPLGALALVVLVGLQGAVVAQTFAHHEQTAIYEAPALRAGAWLHDHPPRAGSLVVSESPGASFASGVEPTRLTGSRFLPDEREAALAALRERADVLVYVDDPPEKYPHHKLNALFPELAGGTGTAEFELVYDANAWERDYGARPVYVYRVRTADDGIP